MSPATNRRVLVVDDNEDAADLLAALLRLTGAEVRVVYDARTALTLAESFLPDSIVLDIAMPGLDGRQLARRIREEAWGREVRLVAVSGLNPEPEADRAAGIDRSLLKPVTKAALHEALELGGDGAKSNPICTPSTPAAPYRSS